MILDTIVGESRLGLQKPCSIGSSQVVRFQKWSVGHEVERHFEALDDGANETGEQSCVAPSLKHDASSAAVYQTIQIWIAPRLARRVLRQLVLSTEVVDFLEKVHC